MKLPHQEPPRKGNKWLVLINMPIQIGIVVFAFAWFGKWLDGKYPNPHRIYVKILTLVGVALAFYNLNRQLKDLNDTDKKS